MRDILKKIGDDRLGQIVGSINKENSKDFESLVQQFPEYDPRFLWIICYPHESNELVSRYISSNYKKFHQVLDSKFLLKLSSKGNFDTRMWEMVVCEMLSTSGTLIPKDESGADFLLKLPSNEIVQVEAVAPNEADDPNLRASRPVYIDDNPAELSGNIEDLERPVLLRFIKGFDDKEKKYQRDIPLIIAINSSKAVGFVSDDNYVLRRVLFGLGYVSITKHDNTYITGLQQNPILNKPAQPSFNVGRFRETKYSHVSGIIYSSQIPHSLIPGGYGWSNQGATFVPNPNALKVSPIKLPFLRKMLCDEKYEEVDAESDFKV